ncbi:MBL fold metallo-hydrolase [Corynebacterium sp. A21]|uniref:MBL fold metallo-hydrolase n=1 Tax=Corynebacterium sp. A21 TaxID=3457318 RepID=UPI003FCFE3F2
MASAVVMSATVLVACSNGEGAQIETAPAGEQNEASANGAPAGNGPLAEARAANINRNVDPKFGETPQVLSDTTGSGLESSRLFFDQSETLVVSGASEAAQLRAASIAVVSHAPAVQFSPGQREQILAEIERLGATKVLTVGDVDLPAVEGVEIFADDGSTDALAELSAKKFSEQPVAGYADMVAATAALEPDQNTLLTASWEQFPDTRGENAEKLPALPAQSRRDAGAAPVIIASPGSSTIDVANARSYGGEVRVMDYHDPRLNAETMEMVAGLSDHPLVALGAQFGTGEQLAEKIELGETVTTELPGGGGLVFPGRRMVALYGHPSGPALGLMGEQPPAEAVARVQGYVDQYQALVEEPVIPAFEVIATVASEFPGDDGNYSNEFAVEDLRPYVDAIVDAGGYAVLDLQPGQASFLEQAKLYEELLKEPNVGLALDPEWKIGPGEQPMQRVGSAEAAEINETADWLATLVKDNGLPQKAFVLHQFQLQMLRDREQINTDHPELAFVLHADGHGTPGDKFATWDALRQGLDDNSYFMAWKNFIDEDFPTFTPEQTYQINPKPWFISYQ